jgi:Holliday junction resolvase RusA-like endonuclease
VKFTFLGNPIPLQRPRVTKSHTYNPQQEVLEGVSWDAHFQIHGNEKTITSLFPLRAPISLSMAFYMPIPKSLSKIKQTALLSKPHIKKPDVDNLIKFYMDALSGVLFFDDKLVHSIHAHKIYDIKPRTEIKVLE